MGAPLIVTPRQLSLRSELYHQLGSMTAAGMTLVDSLRALAKNPPSRAFRGPLLQVVEFIEEGFTFAESMHKLGQWMPAFDLALLHAGERSGRLPQCFQMLSDYYRERAELANAMIGWLAYPVFILHFAFVIFPVERLVALILQGDVMGFVLNKALIFGPLYAIIFLMLYFGQARHGEQWRAVIETVLSFVPVLRTARKSLSMARLSASLEALLSAGVGIVEAWELSATACGSPAVRKAVFAWHDRVEFGGRRPSEEVNDSPVFPELFANLYYSGEISGQLDVTLDRLNKLYQDEGSRKMRTFMRMLSTFIMITIMVAVAFQIIMFYASRFKQIETMSDF